MTQSSKEESHRISPSYGIVVPANWQRTDVLATDTIENWSSLILKTLPTMDQTRLRQDLSDYRRSLITTGTSHFYTFVRPEGDKALLMVLTCSMFSVNPPHDNDDVEGLYRDFLARGDQDWNVSPSMNTLHKNGDETYMRAERLIEETSELPWDESREVRYLFRHSSKPVMAVLTGTSPNISVPGVFKVFDQVADTFFWLSPDLE